jgi:peptidoglycan/xylan/chitin deacetylase (PgdA/CDA1 family)
MPVAAAESEIGRGFAAVDKALYGKSGDRPATPFFRFPGFASSPALLDHLEQRGITVFGADLWASDWNPMTPGQQLKLVLDRLNATQGGIVLFHDTKQQTAAMLPDFLRALKAQDYAVVHVVPPLSRH